MARFEGWTADVATVTFDRPIRLLSATVVPGTGANDLQFVEIERDGTVYSATVVRRSIRDDGDYNVVLVDMDKGPRLLGRVVGNVASDVAIGMRVVASIEKVSFGLYGNTEQPVIVFREV